MALIHDAAASNIIELVSKCLDNKATVSDVDPQHGRTPLHYAAENGHLEMAEFLLTYGARRDIVDFYGMTPVELAEENGHTKLAALLSGKIESGNDAASAQPESVLLEDGSLQFSCPHCGEVLRVPRQYIGAKGKCRRCGETVTATPPPARFESTFVNDHVEALRLLLDEALPTIRVESPGAILEDYKRIAKAWRSDDLVQGAPTAIRAIANKNLKIITALSDFEALEIVADYEGTQAVLAIGHCTASTRPIALRIWRTAERLAICGGRDFIGHP